MRYFSELHTKLLEFKILKPMKKLFTSLALLCASFLTMQAQNCFFQFKGQPLEDGATVTIAAEEDPLFGDMECNTNPASNPTNGLLFVNKGSSAVSGSATITITKKTMSTGNIQWCMGGQCEILKGTTKTKEFETKAGGFTPIQYDCIVKKEGEMLTTLEAKVGNKTFSVTIQFLYGESHVAGVEADVVPVAYYTLDGRQVSQRPHGLCLVKFSDGRVRKVCGN